MRTGCQLLRIGRFAASDGMAVAPLPGQEDTALELTAVRFYRPLAHQTAVEVFCQVPLASLGALAGGSHEVAAAYRVAVTRYALPCGR